MPVDFEKLEIDTIYEVVDLVEVPIFIIEVCGEDLVFRRLNRHYESEVGITSSDVAGKTAGEFLPPRVAETVEKNYRRCIASRTRYEYEELLKIADEEIWWSTTLSPVFDNDRQVKYIIGVAKDITAHKQPTIDLISENSQLKRQNDDIKTLTTIAAHDLRPSIATVRAFSEMILDGFQDLGDGKLDKLQTIHSIADIMSGYVERVLKHAQSVNIRENNRTSFDLDHIIKDIIAASDPDSRFDISYPCGTAEGEVVVYQIILRNLIDNATRYARSRIAVDVKESTERPGQLILSVSDDGEGFPNGVSGFRALLRVMQDNVQRTTGFGLRAVLQLAETREGHFWMDAPKFGDGTTMSVSIPGALFMSEDIQSPRSLENTAAA